MWENDIRLSDDDLRLLESCLPAYGALVCQPSCAQRVIGCVRKCEFQTGAFNAEKDGDGNVVIHLNYEGARRCNKGDLSWLEPEDAGTVRWVKDLRKSSNQEVNSDDVAVGNALFTFSELFAGIGGFGIALKRLCGQCVFASEIDAEARKTYAANCGDPRVESYLRGDIRQHERFPQHTLLTAGFPCQSFSVAGSQEGLTDGRGQLFFEVARVLRSAKPMCFVLENVPNLKIMDDGATFRCILYTLQQCGYRVAHTCIDSSALIAQSRQRLFIVGVRNDVVTSADRPFRWPQLPTALNPKWSHIEDRALRESSPERDELTLNEAQTQQQMEGKLRTARPDCPLRTIMSSYKKSHRLFSELVAMDNNKYRFFSPREIARAQGFPETFRLDCCENRNRIYHQLGNAVPPPVAAAVCEALLSHVLPSDLAAKLRLQGSVSVAERLAMAVMINHAQADIVFEHLDRVGVQWRPRFNHPPVFTCEEADEHWGAIPGLAVKNLFLVSKRKKCYLAVVPETITVNLKALTKTLKEDNLRFGDAKKLMEVIGLTAGSVSIFGLLNAHRNNQPVTLLFHNACKDAERFIFHPNINTISMSITRKDIDRFLESINQNINAWFE